MDSDLFYVEDVEGADIFEVLPAQPAAPVAAAAASTIPQSLWGFDPLHFTHVRLFITTLLKLELFPDSAVCRLYDHPIARVELFGVIVEAYVYAERISILLDDGTGVIQCTIWLSNRFDDHAYDSRQRVRLVQPDDDIMDVDLPEIPETLLYLGSSVRLRGKIRVYKNTKEITVKHIEVENDPNFTILHNLERIKLMKQVYSKPFVPPPPLQANPDSPPPFASPLSKLEQWIFDLAVESKWTQFDLMMVLEYPEALSIAQQLQAEGKAPQCEVAETIVTAFQNLENVGYIWKKTSSGSPSYEVLTTQKIADQAMTIVRQSIRARPLYGVRYRTVSAELRRMPKFSRLADHRITDALRKLVEHDLLYEASSDEYKIVP